jgi:hypothetical protein
MSKPDVFSAMNIIAEKVYRITRDIVRYIFLSTKDLLFTDFSFSQSLHTLLDAA